MTQDRRKDAERLVKLVLEKKSFLILSEDDKRLILDVFEDDMKVESNDYKKYCSLSESKKLENIVIYNLKVYLGNWHVSSDEMEDISEYMKNITKLS